MVGKRIRRVSRGYHYFFVMPSGRRNVHKTAERLMRIDDVSEVSITEGAYGFVVKVQGHSEKGKDVSERISREVGGNTVKAVCHCQYVRR